MRKLRNGNSTELRFIPRSSLRGNMSHGLRSCFVVVGCFLVRCVQLSWLGYWHAVHLLKYFLVRQWFIGWLSGSTKVLLFLRIVRNFNQSTVPMRITLSCFTHHTHCKENYCNDGRKFHGDDYRRRWTFSLSFLEIKFDVHAQKMQILFAAIHGIVFRTTTKLHYIDRIESVHLLIMCE